MKTLISKILITTLIVIVFLLIAFGHLTRYQYQNITTNSGGIQTLRIDRVTGDSFAFHDNQWIKTDSVDNMKLVPISSVNGYANFSKSSYSNEYDTFEVLLENQSTYQIKNVFIKILFKDDNDSTLKSVELLKPTDIQPYSHRKITFEQNMLKESKSFDWSIVYVEGKYIETRYLDRFFDLVYNKSRTILRN